MIDIKHLAQNIAQYENELAKRNMDTTLATKAAELYETIKTIQQELDEVRKQKNDFNKEVLTLAGEAKQEAIGKMKAVAETIKELEERVRAHQTDFDAIIYRIPNVTWDGIPVGKDDEANVETKLFGQKPVFDFEAKNYFELPVFKRDYLGEKGVEAFASRGYYIKGELARFQRILFNYVLENLMGRGFEYVIPPIMVNEKLLYGTGFFPTAKDDVYKVYEGDKEFYLTGTSEAALMFLDSNSVLDLTKPRLLTGWTTCFRKESGTYGKDTQGGIRVHQFEKVETVVICKPEESAAMFDVITNVFTENMVSLGLHVHHLEVSSGDIGIKNNRQIDIEAWFPAQGKYRELSSSSNCTNYQTRNLNIKYQTELGDTELAHSLNCTGVTNRAMFAIMEQFQQADGKVKIPQVLVERFGKEFLE